MGDAGSMFMGLTVIWLLTLETQGSQMSFRPVTALWIIAVPLMDMMSIMYRRIKQGNSPFKADNGHLHHIVIRAGYSSRQALLMISAIAISFSLLGIMGEIYQVSEFVMLLLFAVVFVGYTLALSYADRQTESKQQFQRV